MWIRLLLRLAGLAALGYGGYTAGSFANNGSLPPWSDPWLIGPTLAGAVIGFLVAPYLVIRSLTWIIHRAREIPSRDLFAGGAGLAGALVVAALLSPVLASLPGVVGQVAPIVVAVVLAYLGVTIMVIRQRDLFQLFPIRHRHDSLSHSAPLPQSEKMLLDTSAIIDGRIADIGQTGFLHGTLVVPRFVLSELQRIADSTDSVRRNRGRRGLDMLSRLQKEAYVPLEFLETDSLNGDDVDGKLVILAQQLKSSIVTTDFNLNRVAVLQGVRVLNINELANAVRPVVMPGEELELRILQEGKEQNQGVGFLDDGTMVVVEGGKRYLNSSLEVIVTRVLQTATGRMIFAQPK